ncbi:MAG: sigma factor-like helix-turn-helix DNA-binding protein, partial [Myxococcota bacterium]
PVRTRIDDRVLGLDLLSKLVRSLDERSLDILICRYWDDMTQEEIAEFIGVSRKTVGKRLTAIRARVAQLAAAEPSADDLATSAHATHNAAEVDHEHRP